MPSADSALPGRLVMETRPFFTSAARAFGSDPKIRLAMVVPLVRAMPLIRPDTRWPPMPINTRLGDLMPKKCFTAPTTGSTTLCLIHPPMPFIAPEMPDFRPEIRAEPLPLSQLPAFLKRPVTGLTMWEPTQRPMPLAASRMPFFRP